VELFPQYLYLQLFLSLTFRRLLLLIMSFSEEPNLELTYFLPLLHLRMPLEHFREVYIELGEIKILAESLLLHEYYIHFDNFVFLDREGLLELDY
jgi:hypothetical protein